MAARVEKGVDWPANRRC